MIIEEQNVKNTVREFISRSINFTGWKDDDNLFEAGLVNSLFAVQLMTFLEATFGIEVGTEGEFQIAKRHDRFCPAKGPPVECSSY
jgi:acyl carrier protein